jgi:hypothetical protein
MTLSQIRQIQSITHAVSLELLLMLSFIFSYQLENSTMWHKTKQQTTRFSDQKHTRIQGRNFNDFWAHSLSKLQKPVPWVHGGHVFALIPSKQWLQSASQTSTNEIQESQILEVLHHTDLLHRADKYSHLCRAFLMVASVSEKLRWRLGKLEVSTFSRMVCNELDFRRFDWWDPMSHGGSGRLKDRRVSNATRPLASSCSWGSVDPNGLNKQWRACTKNSKRFLMNQH